MLPGPPPPRAYKGGRGARSPPGQPSPTPPPAPAPALPAPAPPPAQARPAVQTTGPGRPLPGTGAHPLLRSLPGAGVAAVGSVDSAAAPEALGPQPPPGSRRSSPSSRLSACVSFCLCIFSSNFVLCRYGCLPGALCPVPPSLCTCLCLFALFVSIHLCPPVSLTLSLGLCPSHCIRDRWPLLFPALALSPCLGLEKPRRSRRGASPRQGLVPLFSSEGKGPVRIPADCIRAEPHAS